MQLAAVILAGGRGQRLGGAVKAGLRVGGSTLLQRVTAALGPVPAPLLVAAGAIPADQLGLERRHQLVPDLPLDYAGPLAGLAAAVAWLLRQPRPPELLLSVAVDTPFAPPDLVARLTAALTPDRGAAIACYDGQDYPTNGLWRLSALAPLPDAMAAGTAPRSLRRLAADLGAEACSWPTQADGDPFASVNTPVDLAAAEARAAAALPPQRART
jgi:molybdopterin-guanine dinucleotide biosynthesis protein A